MASPWASVHDNVDLSAALVQQFLHVPVTEGEAVVEPNGVLDDGYRETVAVRLGVGHGASASPNPVKATQPNDGVCAPQGSGSKLTESTSI